VEGKQIKLTWSIPQEGGEPAGIESFTLFRFMTQDLDALCLGCPVDFRKFQEVDADSRAIVDGSRRRMTAYDTRDRGYGYMYKVVAFHESGGVSRDSNIVKVLP
jgi:hypothetical protein